MTNKEIKAVITAAGLKNWQIAEEIGINEFTLSRRWRHPLPPSEQQAILDAVKRLRKKEERPVTPCR